MQAQADQNAERMRQEVVAKQQQRVAAIAGDGGKEMEHRKQWSEPTKAPSIAQQIDATGVIVDGEYFKMDRVGVLSCELIFSSLLQRVQQG